MIFLRRWRSVSARIVRLGPVHAETIAELHSRGFARGWSGSEVESLMSGKGVVALGVRLGSAVLGMAILRAAAGEAEILTIAVAPEWRGCGLARRLMDHALDRAAGLGAGRCFLEVDAGNLPATTLYRRLGFEEAGRRKGYYAREGGGDALVLARPLGDRVPWRTPPDTVEFPHERQ
jgi:ribosomal-protein-alanine N-acetyltransferase